MSGARNSQTSILNVLLLSRCSSALMWAVPQIAKVQQCTRLYCLGTAKKTAGRLADRCANDSRDSRCECRFFLESFAAVVRWAIREKAKVQQCTCHCHSLAKKMGDLRTAAPRTLEPRLRHDFLPIFAAMVRQASHPVVRWAARETAKVQHWMCHSKRKLGDLQSPVPKTFEPCPRREFFCHIFTAWWGRYRTPSWDERCANFITECAIVVPVLLRREVSSASNSQSSAMHVPLLSYILS